MNKYIEVADSENIATFGMLKLLLLFLDRAFAYLECWKDLGFVLGSNFLLSINTRGFALFRKFYCNGFKSPSRFPGSFMRFEDGMHANRNISVQYPVDFDCCDKLLDHLVSRHRLVVFHRPFNF